MFLERFSVALVLSVSMGVVQGRALVMVVSRRTVSVVVEVSLVSPSPPQCVLCAKKFALRGLVVGVSAKKFALRAQNGPKMVFSGVLGEFFRGNAAEGIPPGSFFADQQSWDPTGQVVLRRSSGSRARLLAVLTLQCAATCRVNVQMKGPRPPPIGLTRA